MHACLQEMKRYSLWQEAIHKRERKVQAGKMTPEAWSLVAKQGI